MPITDPQAVKFSNELIRSAADLFAQGYYRAKAAVAQYDAKGLDALMDDLEFVDDGSATDGRTPITGADVKAIVAEMRTLAQGFEANSAAKLNAVLKVAVNPNARR